MARKASPAPDEQPTSKLGLFGPSMSEHYPPDADLLDRSAAGDGAAPSDLGGEYGEYGDYSDYSDSDDVDADFAPHARRRVGKLTVLLAAVLVAGIGVLGGIQLQKHNGTTATAAGLSAARAGAFRQAAGARQGAGEGAAGGGFGGQGAGAGTAAGTTGAGSTPAASLAVVGQVTSAAGNTVVVQNLGGTTVTVTTSATTTVTKKLGTPDLAAGQTVAVSGSTAADGAVTATAITIQ